MLQNFGSITIAWYCLLIYFNKSSVFDNTMKIADSSLLEEYYLNIFFVLVQCGIIVFNGF